LPIKPHFCKSTLMIHSKYSAQPCTQRTSSCVHRKAFGCTKKAIGYAPRPFGCIRRQLATPQGNWLHQKAVWVGERLTGSAPQSRSSFRCCQSVPASPQRWASSLGPRGRSHWWCEQQLVQRSATLDKNCMRWRSKPAHQSQSLS